MNGESPHDEVNPFDAPGEDAGRVSEIRVRASKAPSRVARRDGTRRFAYRWVAWIALCLGVAASLIVLALLK